MDKRDVLIISCVAVIAVVFITFLIIFMINSKQIIIIEKYNNSDVSKKIEITDRKQINKIKKICKESKLSTEGIPQDRAIVNGIKIDLQDGRFFMLQLNQDKFCYYENSKKGKKMIVKIPDGLLDIINQYV